MIDPMRHLSSRRRLRVVFWGANVIICVVLLAFALR